MFVILCKKVPVRVRLDAIGQGHTSLRFTNTSPFPYSLLNVAALVSYRPQA